MNKKRLMFSVFCVLILPVSATAQDGLKTPEGGSELTALKRLAEKGDPKSQLDYAEFLKDEDYEGSQLLARKAADQGYAEAWYWLGRNTRGGYADAYAKAAELGLVKAFEPAIESLVFTTGGKADVPRAKKLADLARQSNIKFYNSKDIFLTVDRCFDAGSAELPEADQLSGADLKESYEGVDCFSYKHGIGVPQDWSKYRKCLLTRVSQDYDQNIELAEIYANGWGVKRNGKLALALVCRGHFVPAELIRMVESLSTTINQEKLANEFLRCAFVTSGYSAGFCAALDMQVDAAERSASFASITSKWSPKSRKLFSDLQKVAEEFFETKSSSEIDMSGTARTLFKIAELERLREEFFSNLSDFEAGKTPRNRNLSKADKEMNEAFSRLMKTKFEYGTVSAEGIRKTQKRWLRYRDAWAKFGIAHYKDTTDELWKAWVTSERVDQLNKIIDPPDE